MLKSLYSNIKIHLEESKPMGALQRILSLFGKTETPKIKNQFKPIVEIDYKNDNEQIILAKLDAQDKQYLAEIDNGQYEKHILDEGIPVGDIKLLSWIDKKPIDADFPVYFIYGFQINPRNETKVLKKRGFIRFATPSESLQGLLVAELKEILRKNNLPVSGKKEILLKRIQDNLTDEILSNYVNKKYYCVTESGLELLKKYPEEYVENFRIIPRLSTTLYTEN